MKKFCISLFCLSIIILTIILGANTEKPKEEYLRIHIRANSDSETDQQIKYLVRDGIVAYLTPIVAKCDTKKALQNALESRICDMQAVADRTLSSHGFTYASRVEIKAENFPTRIYDGVTLEGGLYDAIIVYLGEGKGANWWCVAYPPLCFTGENGSGFKYKSKIVEIIEGWKEKQARK